MSDRSGIEGLTSEEAARAAQVDAEVRAALERNGKAVMDSGGAVVVPEAMRGRLRRAQDLRVELGGYAVLPLELRASAGVRALVEPRLREYLALRRSITAELTDVVLKSELGLSDAEFEHLVAAAPV